MNDRYWIRRSWTGLWWVAVDRDPNAEHDGTDEGTITRAWTRDGLVRKLRHRLGSPKSSPWRELTDGEIRSGQ